MVGRGQLRLAVDTNEVLVGRHVHTDAAHIAQELTPKQVYVRRCSTLRHDAELKGRCRHRERHIIAIPCVGFTNHSCATTRRSVELPNLEPPNRIGETRGKVEIAVDE